MAFEGFPKNVINVPPKPPRMPEIPANTLRILLLGVIAAAVLFSTVYTVGPEEEAVVLRFGKYVRTEKPGLRVKMPLGIERMIKVPVQRQLKQEFGLPHRAAGGA